MRIIQLFVSPGHNYFGHHEQPPGEHPLVEKEELSCVAGRGIQGRPLFRLQGQLQRPNHFLLLRSLCGDMQPAWSSGKSPGVTRRNVITAGVDLNSLVGVEFEMQGVRFAGIAECSPCYWMDLAIAPGAEKLLQGRGGLRARHSHGWNSACGEMNGNTSLQLRTEAGNVIDRFDDCRHQGR